MDKTLDLEKRRKIYHLIEKHPSLNLSSIAEMLNMSVQLVGYHTKSMEENALLTITKEEGGGIQEILCQGKDRVSGQKFF
ncbi:MAG: hypothetical protein DRG59_03795 [Deltaproteobacteria bacterium]|nr:MAG: hypothetical protein DRG59_03795 [Deltaproteobacteria bacterium]